MSSIAASAPASGKALGHYPAFRKALLYAALALLFAIYLLPFVRVLTGTVDEGVFLYGAQAVTWGAIPSRDFVEPQGPGSFYWLAMFFKLFGTSLFTARAVLLLTGVATALLTFHLARRTGAMEIFPAVFVLATSVPMMVMNSPHTIAIFSPCCRSQSFFGLSANPAWRFCSSPAHYPERQPVSCNKRVSIWRCHWH